MRFHYDDLQIGAVFETPGITITEDSIIRFGMEYDPQPFHVDRHAAQDSVFGGLIASGLQTIVLSLRQCNQAGLFSQAIAGLSFEHVRFVRPVEPGSTLRARVEVTGKRPSNSHRNAGIVHWKLETLTQDDITVLTMTITNLVKARAAGPAGPGAT